MSARRGHKRSLALEEPPNGENSGLLTRRNGSSSSRSTEDSIDRLTAVLSSFMESNLQRERSSAPAIQGDLVPAFDPNDRNQTAVAWCRKVDELRGIFSWSEEATIYFAMSKLKGLAEVWYKSLPSVQFTWDEWKQKLEQGFPSKRDYCSDLQEMLKRMKRNDETYCKYYYEKLALMNSCEITGTKAVSCIIGGILDNVVKIGAKAGNFLTPESLYAYLCNLDTPDSSKSSLHGQGSSQRHKPNKYKRDKYGVNITCFNCHKTGHTVRDCEKRKRDRNGNSEKRCNFCRHIGHLEEECFLKRRKEKGKETI